MPKRKREAEIEDQISQISDQALRIRVSRLKARFDNGVSQLTAQLRLARGFDRQKMTRRVKQAGSDEAKVERLNAEIQVLKDIKEPKLAKTHLIKQCARTKRIAESEAFIALFGTDPETKAKGKAGPVSVAERNVVGRLFKVEAVSKALPEIMKGIKEILGVDKPNQNRGKVVNGMEKSNIEITEATGAKDDFTGFSDQSDEVVLSNGPADLRESHDDELSTFSDDDIFETYNERLAASSEDEDDVKLEESLAGQDHDRLDDMEVTTDEEAESEIDDEIPSENDSKPLKPVKAPAASTSFLPSLMHGGYYSGSDSEGEPDPDAAFAALTKPERNNRRGQKARQAIAEKKYGSRANHLLKAKGAESVHGERQKLIQSQSRNDGWDARKGAVSSTDRRGARTKEKSASKAPNRFERRNGFAKVKESSGKRANLGTAVERPHTAKTTAKTGEKLHPSWEAARKKKLESASAGAGSFAGKKITFD